MDKKMISNDNCGSNIHNERIELANINSTIDKLNTEELREYHLMKENFSSILGRIKNIKNGLTENHIGSNNANHTKCVAKVLRYEEFYAKILRELKK